MEVLSHKIDLESDYLLVGLYDSHGFPSLGDALLALMQQNTELSTKEMEELQGYIAYREMMHDWEAMGYDIAALSEGALDSLEQYAARRDRVGMDALSLLEVNDRLIIDYPVLFPDTSSKSLTSTTSRIEKTPVQEGRLEIYPNPTERYFTLDYRVDKMHEHLTYRIIHVQGRVMTEHILVNEEDQVLIDSVLPSGPYLIELMVDGVRYKSTDLIVK